MDKLTKEQRKKNMQAVKATGSKIEIALSKMLFARGHRYRKNDKTVFGKPDLTFKKHKIAIFVDGEFWHGKDWEIRKNDHKTNQKFWFTKIERNIERDNEVNTELERQGWIVLRFWGKEIEKDLLNCVFKIEKTINDKTINFNGKNSITKIFGNKLKVRVIKSENAKEAVITHYLHNQSNSAAKFYKQDAVAYTKEILQYKYPGETITLNAAEEELQYQIFQTADVPFLPVKNPKFNFIDLFAGIGGFRLALQNLGGKCIFTSEWDDEAKRTYKANFGDVPFGDITKEETEYVA